MPVTLISRETEIFIVIQIHNCNKVFAVFHICVPGGRVHLAVISVVSATSKEEVSYQVLVQALALR